MKSKMKNVLELGLPLYIYVGDNICNIDYLTKVIQYIKTIRPWGELYDRTLYLESPDSPADIMEAVKRIHNMFPIGQCVSRNTNLDVHVKSKHSINISETTPTIVIHGVESDADTRKGLYNDFDFTDLNSIKLRPDSYKTRIFHIGNENNPLSFDESCREIVKLVLELAGMGKIFEMIIPNHFGPRIKEMDALYRREVSIHKILDEITLSGKFGGFYTEDDYTKNEEKISCNAYSKVIAVMDKVGDYNIALRVHDYAYINGRINVNIPPSKKVTIDKLISDIPSHLIREDADVAWGEPCDTSLNKDKRITPYYSMGTLHRISLEANTQLFKLYLAYMKMSSDKVLDAKFENALILWFKSNCSDIVNYKRYKSDKFAIKAVEAFDKLLTESMKLFSKYGSVDKFEELVKIKKRITGE